MNKEVKPKSNNDKDVNIIKHLDKIDNDKGSKNKLTESVNVYTAFATKLKMNKKLNFSKKETANEEEIAKLNSGTNLVNKTSKTKAIHLSNEKISYVLEVIDKKFIVNRYIGPKLPYFSGSSTSRMSHISLIVRIFLISLSL